MFDKKKYNFWRLALVFGALTVVILILWWISPNHNISSMDGTMGNMMKTMHLQNITLYDLLAREEAAETMKEMHSHHQGQSRVIKNLNFFTTGVIFVSLPLIVGGTVALAVVWLK